MAQNWDQFGLQYLIQQTLNTLTAGVRKRTTRPQKRGLALLIPLFPGFNVFSESQYLQMLHKGVQKVLVSAKTMASQHLKSAKRLCDITGYGVR